MFGGVTALLEKLDQQVEAIATEQERSEAEREEAEEEETRRHFAGSPSSASSRAAHDTDGTGGAGYHRQRADFPPLPPHTMPSRTMGQAAAAGGGGGVFESRAPHPSSLGSGRGGSRAPSSSAEGGGGSSSRVLSQAPLKGVNDTAPSAAPSLSSSANAPHSPSATGGGGLRSLFASAGAAPTVESLKLQCSSLQQSNAALAESLRLAEASLEERQTAVDRLTSECAAADTEKSRWQREAVYYKDVATTSRNQLAQCEGEVRVLRQLQEETRKELDVYKASAKQFMEESEAEVMELKKKLQCRPTGAADTADADESAAANRKRAELEATVSQLRARQLDGEAERRHLQAALAVAEREREQAQLQQQQLEQRVDTLLLDVQALKESLEGELVAQQEMAAQLKQARSELQAAQAELQAAGCIPSSQYVRTPQQQQQQEAEDGSSAASPEQQQRQQHAASLAAMTIANLEEALSEAQQRCQVVSLQLMEMQTAQRSSAQEAAEWRGRHNALARRLGDDADAAAVVGYGGVSRLSGGGGAPSFPRPPGMNARQSDSGEVAVHVLGSGAHSRVSGGVAAAAATSGGGATALWSDLRRESSVHRVLRRGRVGQLAVEVLAKVDDATLQVVQYLRHRAVARVAAEGYICLLQLWVLLVFVSNLAMTAGSE